MESNDNFQNAMDSLDIAEVISNNNEVINQDEGANEDASNSVDAKDDVDEEVTSDQTGLENDNKTISESDKTDKINADESPVVDKENSIVNSSNFGTEELAESNEKNDSFINSKNVDECENLDESENVDEGEDLDKDENLDKGENVNEDENVNESKNVNECKDINSQLEDEVNTEKITIGGAANRSQTEINLKDNDNFNNSILNKETEEHANSEGDSKLDESSNTDEKSEDASISTNEECAKEDVDKENVIESKDDESKDKSSDEKVNEENLIENNEIQLSNTSEKGDNVEEKNAENQDNELKDKSNLDVEKEPNEEAEKSTKVIEIMDDTDSQESASTETINNENNTRNQESNDKSEEKGEGDESKAASNEGNTTEVIGGDEKSNSSDVLEAEGENANKEITETELLSTSDISADDSIDGQQKTSEKTKDIEFVELPCEKDRDKGGPSNEFNNDDEKDDVDPIGADAHEEQGADEELCIIPDTERVLSQEEREAASTMTPLKDLEEEATQDSSQENKYIITLANHEDSFNCLQCSTVKKPEYQVTKNSDVFYLCKKECMEAFEKENKTNCIFKMDKIRVKNLQLVEEPKDEQPQFSFERKCAECGNKTDDDESNLAWEIMDFCNEFCLTKYQKQIGSKCSNCSQKVRPNSLGKYCVRFGNDIRQFCTSNCLEEFKKGLKMCSFCQQDMSKGNDGFLAPVGDKGLFKDFCSQNCMEKFNAMTTNHLPHVDSNIKCSVCKGDNRITIEFEGNYFCNDKCFVAYSFVNNVSASKCNLCRRYFSNDILRKHTMIYDNVQYSFCSDSCQSIYIIAHRKIVPCAWCKVKKYNFDMIRRYLKDGPVINMCSINCFSLFQVSINAVSSKKTQCNYCNKRHQPMYHLTMSDATIRNFCSYSCVMSFQNKFKSPLTLNKEEEFPVPTGQPKKNKKFMSENILTQVSEIPPSSSPTSSLPVISSVQSLATTTTKTTRKQTTTTTTPPPPITNTTTSEPPKVIYRNLVIIKPEPLPEQRNVGTMCRVRTATKGIQNKVIKTDKSIQTDSIEVERVFIPVPVPIYVPSPLPMYSVPTPYPLPFPLPIPIPIFIPTTRNSSKGIMKEIKKIQVKIPTDPYEAELLMMAEMVAGDKKEENTDSESDGDNDNVQENDFSPEPVDPNNSFGDDMLQMALKMATELDEPAVDLEGALTANTITAPQGTENQQVENDETQQSIQQLIERPSTTRGRKRGTRGNRTSSSSTTTKKRRLSQPIDQGGQTSSSSSIPITPPQPPEPIEKPDANFCLKYTFGVNAWKQWIQTKNAELEKTSKFSKLFKTEILQLTADELNYSLCMFVKEVRKPTGAEYAPDTIYYLCLGIQQYLYENNRIDNIFCDPYYEQFTDSLDEVAKKFTVLYNDAHYIVTRVEEEHLWESKQLGAHSPHVLLSTLMFFNTKHFNLTTVDEHMQLSFSHIMKHWKRNPSQGGSRTPGSRNVLLRFYPPQSAIQNNTKKKKVYEQQENDENPLRCPVKLYEFYLSKCPESVKTRNDVFYLQPERSCVPDSPVWYSTSALPREALEKMLHRVRMVKEINVALLTS